MSRYAILKNRPYIASNYKYCTFLFGRQGQTIRQWRLDQLMHLCRYSCECTVSIRIKYVFQVIAEECFIGYIENVAYGSLGGKFEQIRGSDVAFNCRIPHKTSLVFRFISALGCNKIPGMKTAVVALSRITARTTMLGGRGELLGSAATKKWRQKHMQEHTGHTPVR